MNKYEQIKQQQEKLRLARQHTCSHLRLDMIVIKRHCFDCGFDVPFRTKKDIERRGHIGCGDSPE
jgi:hypothetical protein